jgi:hypothetical protein
MREKAGTARRQGREVLKGVDGASASSGERDDRRGLTGCLGACIDSPLTGLAQRFVDQAGERLRFFGTSASRSMGLKGRMRYTG